MHVGLLFETVLSAWWLCTSIALLVYNVVVLGPLHRRPLNPLLSSSSSSEAGDNRAVIHAWTWSGSEGILSSTRKPIPLSPSSTDAP